MRARVISVAIDDQFPEASRDAEHLVPGGQSAQSRERHAHARGCAGDNERLTPGPLDGVDPSRIIPSVDLASARHIDRFGIALMDLGDQWTIRTDGTDAVVDVEILARWATFANAVTFERSTGS